MVMRRRVSGCWLLVALGASGAHAVEQRAEEVRVISAQPDSVSVTIYRDLFALITETRTVDLPAGPVTLVFDGVAETLMPQSAVVADTGRELRESNYDFELLTAAKLMEKNIGREMLLTRTNPATGKVRQVKATLIAANTEGVVFRSIDGNEALHCSGLPERLSFEELPGELTSKPTLSIRLAAGTPGKRQVRVSYLAHGFGWSADYVGKFSADSGRLDLHGWITLHNLTRAGFRDAQVQVVAGRLNLLDFEEDRGSSLIGATSEYLGDEFLDAARIEALEEAREDPDSLPNSLGQSIGYFSGCYPLGSSEIAENIVKFPDLSAVSAVHRLAEMDGAEQLDEVVVTGFRMSMAVRENLADYQMYRLPSRTDLAARQTKQVAFLHTPEVKVERFYGIRLSDSEEYGDEYAAESNFVPIDVKVGWRNRKADGLGEPLPGGLVRFFESAATGLVFAGDARLADTSVDTPVELVIGKSVDLGIAFEGSAEEPEPSALSLFTRRVYLPMHLRVLNDKTRPVVVEIRQGPMSELQDLRVVDASLAPKRKAGDYMWRFEVPAQGEQELSYKVGGRVPDWMRD
jgi:hypothetical protein